MLTARLGNGKCVRKNLANSLKSFRIIKYKNLILSFFTRYMLIQILLRKLYTICQCFCTLICQILKSNHATKHLLIKEFGIGILEGSIRNLGLFRIYNITKKFFLFIIVLFEFVLAFILMIIDMIKYLIIRNKNILLITGIISIIIISSSVYTIIWFMPSYNVYEIIKLIINFILSIILKTNNVIGNLLEYLIFKLNKKDEVRLIGKQINKSSRYRTFVYSNEGLLNHKEALRSIYSNLMNNVDFTSFGKHKVVIITALVGDIEYNFHPNVYLSNNTRFEEYYDNVKRFVDKHYTSASSHIYLNDIIPMFSVKVWDMDSMKNANIKRTVVSRPVFKRHYSTANSIDPRIKNKKELNDINDGLISPYEIKNPHSIKPFGTMDVETMNINNKQVPIAISMCFSMPFDPNCKTEPKTRFFIINRKLLKVDVHKAVLDLFTRYFKYVAQLPPHTIFVHNLGSFDGYFILKYLTFAFNADRVLSIVDDSNKFIQISLCLKDPNEKLKSDESIPYTYWKDSYRIFPVSLNDLAKVFNKGEGKTSPYNPEFNSISMFNNKKLLSEFRKYSVQDSVALYKSMRSAILAYHEEYNIDLSDVLSTSSLSLKIFRTNFLDSDIPILKSTHDKYVRKAYIGGATDYYKLYGQNLHYYDVNSLYPYSMGYDMPLELIKFHPSLKDWDLSNFFGFALAEIYCPGPDTVRNPVLPYKCDKTHRTIYPRGKWSGIYFSEELKAVKRIGYEVKLIHGYEFSRYNLFMGYVDHFYDMKRNSVGASRFIAKMHLNTLYGIFGRRKETISTVIIDNKHVDEYLVTKVVKSIIKIGEDKSIMLLQDNIPEDIIKHLNITSVDTINSRNSKVNSNVAIAAAITSYARIHMMKFKLNGNIFYTDTDSVFTDKPLDFRLIGSELGLMKDELNGLLIKEAYFLGVKKYGYWYLDEFGNRIEKSTIAGIPKNSVSFDEIKSLVAGKSLTRDINNSFFHDFSKLDINIKSHKATISFNPEKELINNEYQAPTINTTPLSFEDELNMLVKTTMSRYFRVINKFKSDV